MRDQHCFKRGTITFASVTLVPTGEGGKTRARRAVRVRRALRAVGRAPEVVRAAARGKDLKVDYHIVIYRVPKNSPSVLFPPCSLVLAMPPPTLNVVFIDISYFGIHVCVYLMENKYDVAMLFSILI